jgi:KDO2-lipid IV(A) lauroyltransferase
MQFGFVVLLKVLVVLFSWLPFRFLYLLSDFFTLLLRDVFRYRRQVVIANLMNAFPQKSPHEIQLICDRYYSHLCDVLVETIKGFSASKTALQGRFRYVGTEVFAPYFSEGKSAVLYSSHYGNWEWGVLTFPLVIQHWAVGPYKPLKNSLLDACLKKLRERFGAHAWNMAHIHRAIVQLRSQPCIFTFFADQTPVDVLHAHWTTFLQQDTPFLHGVEKIARSTGYPVFMSDVRKISRGFYEVSFIKLCEDPKTLTEGELTERYARQLEQIIERQPEYWLWSHRRWKRKRPAGISVDG